MTIYAFWGSFDTSVIARVRRTDWQKYISHRQMTILEVGHPGIWSRDINIWGTVLGIYLHFIPKIRFFNSVSRAY